MSSHRMGSPTLDRNPRGGSAPLSGPVRTVPASARWLGVLLIVLSPLFLLPDSALADPDYPGPLLYGLDPVIHSTDDARLLGVERLRMREHLRLRGIDPLLDGDLQPGLYSRIRLNWRTKSRVDLVRLETVTEYNGVLGLMTRIEYPSYFFLFPSRQELAGGFVYYPPRPLDDPVVSLFIDDLESAQRRERDAARERLWTKSLNVLGTGRGGDGGTNLLNLTIPIKLPRTLEKIIGRGEKTRIKISGREHISIGGESSVTKPFTPNERIQSQSYFPSLDMKQQLQVNLSGTIGEKIIIEVDHDSEAIGPDGTKIKLMYRGLEDEIIETIEAGDVGLTLPNSSLLGYSSNKSGLFGVKVTGQVGRADFTVVASKQKAEASSKTFNSSGGTLEDHVYLAHQYLKNRFYFLDLDPAYTWNSEPYQDSPGRPDGFELDTESLKVYKTVSSSSQNYDVKIAVYLDPTGVFWNDAYGGGPAPDFAVPYMTSERWELLSGVDFVYDTYGDVIHIDLGRQVESDATLAVTYTLKHDDGRKIQIGDDPDQTLPLQEIDGKTYFRMKLLKAPESDQEEYTFQYALRNVYSLGGARIDAESFQLRIEHTDPADAHPELDENGIPYLQIFGLDQSGGTDGGPDGVPDMFDEFTFNLQEGLLSFPLDFPKPFNSSQDRYVAYGGSEAVWGGKLAEYIPLGEGLYLPTTTEQQMPNYSKFRIVASHASAASSFSLGASNIEEGSETVTLDGRTLTRGTDYEIDYTFGQITLKGDAAILTATSQISVNYSYSPFMGGGTTNLMGFNLGYDLGRDSKLSTTWLYESESIVGEKAKLGEEPNRTLVGNVNFLHTFKPYFLTHIANFLSRRDSERESRVQLSGELAISLPNPNTMDKVYLEDFEGVDASDIISLTRGSWFWASAPIAEVIEGDPFTTYDPEDRVEAVRWFLPRERVLRRYLNPDLEGQERDETQSSMDMYLHANAETGWTDESWGGIMRGISRTGLDLSRSQFLEFWVNDAVTDSTARTGRLHIDFGFISEDGFWPEDSEGNLVVGQWEREDGILTGTEPDGVWTADEDVGLNGKEWSWQRYDATYDYDGTVPYPGPEAPFPGINGTARNNLEDTEDLNGNWSLDEDDIYFSAVVSLRDSALVDVLRDYPESKISDLRAEGHAWRKYRIRLSDALPLTEEIGKEPNIQAITHMRVWFEDPGRQQNSVRLQLSDLRFLGSRWEREGVRSIEEETLLSDTERLPGEEFYLGEVNNKDNPDYIANPPPFEVPVREGIEEKEQSILLDFRNLERGHLVRAGKLVSPSGDDYTRYRDMSWYWYNPSDSNKDLDLFFRVGSDTLNFYEVSYRFSESAATTGWQQIKLDMAELANVKTYERDTETGEVNSTIPDVNTGQDYRVRVVGVPDLRSVTKYFFGVVNDTISPSVDGYVYLNDVKLEGVKRDMGLAGRAGVSLAMADVLKVDFDWQNKDAEFRGLDSATGSGVNFESWNFSASANVDDFIPLLGFQLPVSVRRSQQTTKPKYFTNSDIEIFEEAVQDSLSTVSESESFTTQLKHTPSKAALLRYVVDPWQVKLTGSRGSRSSPLERSSDKSLNGSLNYNLRIPGRRQLGDLPLLGYVPVVRGVGLLPEKVEAGASFTSTTKASVAIDLDGTEIPRLSTKRRTGKLNGAVDYKPHSLLALNVSGSSDRDLLYENKAFGVNIGEETNRKYSTRATISMPKPKDLPQNVVFYPARQVVRGLNEMRPSLQFTGNFNDNRNRQNLQPDDPQDLHSISNDGSWDLRFTFPMGDLVKSVFPEKTYSEQERQRMLEDQRRREQQDRRRDRSGAGDQTADALDDPNLTPEERQRLEEERLLEEAELRLEEERERQGGAPELQQEEDGGRRIPIPNPMTLVMNTLRNTKPVKFTLTQRKTSAYGRTTIQPEFWYKAGLLTNLDEPDSLTNVLDFQDRKSLSMSTSTQIVKSLSLDVKYSTDRATLDRLGSVSRDYKQEWPDAQVSLAGMEKWRILGGKPEDPTGGWFKGSSVSLGYKHTKTVSGMTETVYNPKKSTSINPRWTFNFHNGMTATLTSSIAADRETRNGVLTESDRVRYGLQFKHQFRAQRLLAKIGLYRPGANPTITMDVDINYMKNESVRTNPGAAPSAPTGSRQYGVTPRFSYQISRNLSSALNLGFNNTANIATGVSTTKISMGMEVTFVF